MKKILLLAVCAMTIVVSCKNKGKIEAVTAQDSVAAVIDSIIEENDTTPMPMFLMGQDKQYGLMLYWTDLEEPQKKDDNDDYFETSHQLWTLQEMFRRNKTAYTNMLMGDKFFKIKFIDEVLEDPDGNRPGTGERHRPEIPSLCARFDFANPKEKVKEEWGYNFGTVIVTDSYLASRKLLPVEFDEDSWSNPKPLPHAQRIFTDMFSAVRIKTNQFHSPADFILSNHSPDHREKFQIFISGKFRQKTGALNDSPDILRQLDVLSDDFSVNFHGAGRRAHKSQNHPHQHGFPGPVAA